MDQDAGVRSIVMTKTRLSSTVRPLESERAGPGGQAHPLPRRCDEKDDSSRILALRLRRDNRIRRSQTEPMPSFDTVRG